MRLWLAICALVILAAADSHAARTVEGIVRAVYDGDTILLVARDASRLYLFDLAGAAAGCLLLIPVIDALGAVDTILLVAVLGASAAAVLAGATGKDVIITLCGLYNHDECLNAAVEFTGPGMASLSMDARLSISNMTTEWGPLVGWFPVDAATIAYMRGVHARLKALGVERFTERDIEGWAANPPAPDSDAAYAARIVLDLAEVTPHVSGPDTVQTMQSLAEMEAKKVRIQKAYLVSCVNSRVEDLDPRGTSNGTRASASARFARTIRCATVGSGTRNARAISAVASLLPAFRAKLYRPLF